MQDLHYSTSWVILNTFSGCSGKSPYSGGTNTLLNIWRATDRTRVYRRYGPLHERLSYDGSLSPKREVWQTNFHWTSSSFFQFFVSHALDTTGQRIDQENEIGIWNEERNSYLIWIGSQHPRDTTRNIVWGCAVRFPKPLPYLWPIFHTLIITWLRVRYPIYDLILNQYSVSGLPYI